MFELALTLTILGCVSMVYLANEISKVKVETAEIVTW